jgi:hypothetical protein
MTDTDTATLHESAALASSGAGEDASALGDEARAKAAALNAIAQLKAKLVNAESNPAQANGADNGQIAPAEAKPRKKRFGPPANAPREVPKPRKRRSRWETEETTSTALIVNSKPLWPVDVTLPGGITVRAACLRPMF